MDKKRIAIIIFSVVLVAVLGVYAWQRGRNGYQTPYHVTDVSAFSLPAEFPQGLPVPAGSKLVRNFTASDASGELIQSVQVYNAPLTPTQVFGLFQTFFFANKMVWMIDKQLTDVNPLSPKSIFATGPRGKLVVDISPLDQNSRSSTLELRFIPIKKNQ